MRVLQINIRLSEGGAGRVAYDLHTRLCINDVESHFAYGYASGIKDDPRSEGHAASISRLSNKLSVGSNFLTHKLVGRDFVTPNAGLLRQLIAHSDVVHLHAVHHYFLDTISLIEFLSVINKPTVITIHDWWYITGRCGFPGSCRAWNTGCGACATHDDKDHLPSFFDFSATHLDAKRAALQSMQSRIRWIAPSAHIANDYKSAYPNANIVNISNTYDSTFESLINSSNDFDTKSQSVLVSAADLSYRLKTNHRIIEGLISASNIPITTVGKNSPFNGPRVENLGYLSDRAQMLEVMRNSKAMLYTSQVDNAPLTIIESLCAGLPVVATSSPAADEILARVSGRTLQQNDNIEEAISNPWILYESASSRFELQEIANEIYSPDKWVQSHIQVYKEVVQSVRDQAIRQ